MHVIIIEISNSSSKELTKNRPFFPLSDAALDAALWEEF